MALFFLLMADKHVDNFIEKIQGINLIVYEWYETDKKKLGDVIEDLLIDAYLDGALAAEDYLDFAPNTDVDTTKMFETINKDVAGKTFRQRVDEYVDNNGSLDEIVRVAETEFHRVYNEGIIQRGEKIQNETGRTISKRWITVVDEVTRETHLYLDGTIVPFDGEFYTFDGDHAFAPGGFAKAENNINCRCTIDLIYN